MVTIRWFIFGCVFSACLGLAGALIARDATPFLLRWAVASVVAMAGLVLYAIVVRVALWAAEGSRP